MKRYLVLIFILIVAAAAGYLYFSDGDIGFSKDSAAYKAVPVSAPFFFEVKSVNNLSLNNPIIHELTDAGIGDSWFGFLQKADSLIKSEEKLPKSLLNSSFLITWGYSGRSQMVPLIIMKAESAVRKKALQEFLFTLYPQSQFKYLEMEYGKNLITEITRVRPQESLFYTFANDLFLVSAKSITIEQVILQMSTPGILENPYFNEVNKITGNQDVSFFLNHEHFNGFLGNILNRNVLEKTDEFGIPVRFRPLTQAQKFKNYASWSELDIQLEKENIILRGISAADDSLNHFLSIFNDQQPVRYSAEDVLPVNTSFYCSYAFSAKKNFFERLEDYYTHSADYYHREERMKRFDKGLRTNIRNLFADFVKDEMIVAATTIPVNPQNKTVYFIVHTNGRTHAEKQLNNLLDGYASRAGLEKSAYVSEFSVDNEVRFPVYRFPYPSFPGLWLGNPFTMADASYVSFYENYMVFSNSEKGLHEYLRNMILGTTLAKDLRYQHFRQNNSSHANVSVFVDVNKIFSYRNVILSETFLKPVNEKEENIRKFGQLSWQVRHDKTTFFNTVAVSYQPVSGEEANTTWQSVIGGQLYSRPQLLINHTSSSERDILLQDNQHSLHQVSGSGRTRWSISLPEPVLSEIHQVDIFRNGRLQYLFNTKEKLYLVDRNGNHVSPFPVNLPAPATNGLSVFDYDKNRDYRIFVACEDLRVYAFDSGGKIISGWKFDKTDSRVTTPIRHFKVEGKDYIAFKDESGIYILDRQGAPRVSVPRNPEFSKNPLMLNMNGKPKIVATGKNGKVYYIYFNGTVEEKRTPRFSENHLFTVDDIDGNNIPDFVFADGNELSVTDENGKKLFSRKFKGQLMYTPQICTLSGNLKKIGVTDAATNRIYLLNPDGKLHEGFPLQGNSEFSIGKLSDNSSGFNLVVGSEGGMLLNYTLN